MNTPWPWTGRCGLRAVVLALASFAPIAAPAALPDAPPAPDTMAARVAACVACHGQADKATQAGYFPRIAGKPAGYLYQQLLNFREGRRHYAPMVHLVQHLSDDYLREIAAHFAGLDLPYPARPPTTATLAQLQRGETLVRQGDAARGLPACAACHGSRLGGGAPSVPGLLGLPRDYLNAQLGAWRTGARQAQAPDCMASVARRLAPEDVAAVSSWLSSRPAAAHTAVAPTWPLPLPCGGVSP